MVIKCQFALRAAIGRVAAAVAEREGMREEERNKDRENASTFLRIRRRRK